MSKKFGFLPLKNYLFENDWQNPKVHKKLYKITKFCNPMCICSWDTSLWTCQYIRTCRECYNISLIISTTCSHVKDSDAPSKLYIVGKVCSSSTILSQKHCSISCPTWAIPAAEDEAVFGTDQLWRLVSPWRHNSKKAQICYIQSELYADNRNVKYLQ